MLVFLSPQIFLSFQFLQDFLPYVVFFLRSRTVDMAQPLTWDNSRGGPELTSEARMVIYFVNIKREMNAHCSHL
jgi:hypothetical protein